MRVFDNGVLMLGVGGDHQHPPMSAAFFIDLRQRNEVRSPNPLLE
jgi:hypothetical protein